MHTDPIADMLTRIRNAQMARKSEVILPYSKLKFNVAQILNKHGYLGKVEKLDPILAANFNAKNNIDRNSKFNQLRIELIYNGKKPKINFLKRVSKPGKRVYVSTDKLPVVLNNHGIAIVSTPKGLLTNIEAKQAKVGGEIICEIY
jgi:small subunit ribosomal protein S8